MKVALVDDQPLVRAGLQRILASDPELEIAWEASDGAEALAELRSSPVDVIVMDVRMRGMDGVEATRRVRDGDGPPVLVLTTFDEDEVLWGAIDAGAAGFILKEASAEDLIRATTTVAQGGAWLDPSVTGRVLAARRGAPPGAGRASSTGAGLVDGLTDREQEVLGLLATGMTNGEIADELIIGRATVKTHVGSIFSKLGARDRAAAIVYAHQHGLLR